MKQARDRTKPDAERPAKTKTKAKASHLIEVEGATPLPRVLETLEALVAALRTGSVEVRHGEESIVLGPREVLGFELSARSKGKRQRLTLELKWRKYGAADADLDLAIRPGPAPALARAISDYANAAGDDAGATEEPEGSEATEVTAYKSSRPSGPEAAGEAHEGEAVKTAAFGAGSESE